MYHCKSILKTQYQKDTADLTINSKDTQDTFLNLKSKQKLTLQSNLKPQLKWMV